MAYYKPINLVKGDDLPMLQITLRDSNVAASGKVLKLTDPTSWRPIDLVDLTAVVMKFKKIGTSSPVHSLTCTRQLPYIDGLVIMNWGLTTLDGDTGDYEGEIEMTFTSGKVLTIADKFKFIVREQF